MDKKALIESLKEGGRIVMLAVIPVVVSSLESESIINWESLLQKVLVVAGLALLRMADKYLHELAPKGESRGLTGF